MKVSIYDVAKKSGLSVVTVSRVLNNSSSVREKNRQKVLQAMQELNYNPSAAARSLARGQTGLIGVITRTMLDSFLHSIINEISNVLDASGYYLALSVSPEMKDKDHYLIQEDRVDGLIILSPLNESEYVNELTKRKMPFVLIDSQLDTRYVSKVVVDNEKGGYDATKYLIELGHRKIAHIRGPQCFLSAKEREEGFLRALQEAGIEPYVISEADYSIPEGYRVVKEWIAQGIQPTAIFAGDDVLAVGAINALMSSGICVPDDISVIGYDDQSIAQELRPYLTTVRQPSELMAETAVDMLLKQINGTLRNNMTVKLESELIIRDSTRSIIES